MIHLTHPWLLAALVPLAAWVIVAEARADGSASRRLLRAALRLAILALIAVALADPTVEASAPASARRLVIATDTALGTGGRAEAAAIRRAATEEANREEAGTTEREYEGRAASGLSRALLEFRPGETGTVLLLTNGRGDLQGLDAVAQTARVTGIRVLARVVPRSTAPPSKPGLRIRSLDLPRRVRGPFTVRTSVSAGADATVQVLVEGRVLGEAAVSGNADVSFDDLVLEPGLHEVAVRVASSDTTAMPTLDRRLVQVESPPSVWISSALPPTSLPRRALQAQGFRVRDLPPTVLAQALTDAGPRPDLVLMDAAAALALGPAAQTRLVASIEDGLGLFLLAGEDEEAWGRLAGTPLADILPIVPLAPKPEPEPEPPPLPPPVEPEPPVEKPEEDDRPGLTTERRPDEALPISMLLVLDRSGSMEGAKLEMAIEGAKRSAGMLSPNDRIGIITFAEDATLDIPMTQASGANLGWRLTTLKADGNTDIYGALVKASQVLAKEKAPIRHLLLLTDGHQTGRDAIFGHLVRSMGEAGVTLTAVGLGPNHDEVLLKNIAMWAPRGHYRPADSERQLPAILVRDTRGVVERRRNEAESLGLLPDPDPTPEPRPEPEPAPLKPAPPTTEPPEAGPTRPTRLPAKLALVRPHEATAGIDDATLPVVAPPYGSEGRRGTAVLVRHGEERIVLAASRHGLGRVISLALAEDAEGLGGWADRARLLVQAARSVRAPLGVGHPVFASVIPGADGRRLRLDADPDAPAEPVRVRWSSGERREDLGAHVPGRSEDLALPEAPPGEAAVVVLLDPRGRPAAPPLTYLGRTPDARVERAGDAKSLERALGPDALDERERLLQVSDAGLERRRFHALFVLMALILLPFDVWAHRRPGRVA